MPKPPFKPTQRRLLIGSAIALALFANPFSYDFAHQEWQVTKAFAESCFVAGTRITMADGSERLIETLQAGERVLDQYGHTNQILAVERVLLGDRRLYGINQLPPFFTGEHPFLTTRGWAAISPAMTRVENPTLIVLPLFTGMRLLGWSAAANTGNLALAPQPVERLVESLYWIDAPPTTELFNLVLNGTHSYIANSLIVHNKDGNGGGSDHSGGGSDHGGGGSDNSGGGSDHGGGGSDNSGGGSGHGGGGSDNSGGGGDHGGGGSDNSGGGGDHGGGGSDNSGGGSDHGGGGSDNNGGGSEHGGGGSDNNGGGSEHGGDEHAGGDLHAGGRGLGNGLDDNGVDAVDANGNKLRGDGTVDDNGVDAVDANGNKLRGDGTVDDNGVDTVDANGNKLRGDGTVDDNGVDAVDANGNKLRGDGTVDDRQQVLTDEQERALLNNGFRQQGQP
ncbi:Hint domain-containing protein [Aeromonas sp. SG16]|uniref:Hint domain-containing protein n=1 Tax=Aeromonas sp. SG16 TaxID=2950548 RepID=UPI00210C8930|nr:Hint domain-containing protein [Aeromonas sp. SG16]MCQ4054172.1 Hint domain-containing protein [Aeromonas sp. SG16]